MASGSSAMAATLAVSAPPTFAAIPRPISFSALPAEPFTTRPSTGLLPAAAGRSTVPLVRTIGESPTSLTLNLGLAWDMTTPISEAHGRLANYIPNTGQLLIANQNGVSSSAGVQMDWTALEPRIGAAWKVFGSDNTVLRAGFAIFHDSAWSQGAQGLWQNPPFLGESDAFPPSAAAPLRPRTALPCLDRRPPPSVSPADFRPFQRHLPLEHSPGRFIRSPLTSS